MRKTIKFKIYIILLLSLSAILISGILFNSKTINKKEIYSLKNYLNNEKYPYDYWKTSTPEKEGLDINKLRNMLKYIDNNRYDINSLLIIKNGYMIFERYAKSQMKQLTPDDTHQVYSTTKSIISSLIGIAIKENYIKNENEKMITFFKDYKIDNLTEDKKNITIKDILLMKSGIHWDMNKDDRAYYDLSYVLNKKMEAKPGDKWHYNTGSSHLLSGIIYYATGLTPLEYANKTLFKSLGIKNAEWQADKNGIHYGGWGLLLKPRDMAKFGLLYLKKGKFNNKQIVSEEWAEKSVKNHTGTYWSGDYGYHWWVPELGGFATRGLNGQNIYILPEKNIVVVFTSNLPADKADMILEKIMSIYLIPACKN